MSHENKKEDCEDTVSIQDSTLEELKKAKDESDIINFMDIVDNNCMAQSDETSKDGEEMNIKERVEDSSHSIEANPEAFSNEQEYEYSPKQGTIKNKLEMFERHVQETNRNRRSTKDELEELNSYVRDIGQEKKLLDNLADELKSTDKTYQIAKSEIISELKPFRREKDEKKVIRLNSDILGVKGLPTLFVDNLRIKKYPGFLYINISSIQRYMSADQNVKSVNVRLESEDMVYETPEYDESPTINMNTMVYLSVANMDTPIKIRFILQKNLLKGVIGEKVEKVCESELIIDKGMIDKIHNNIKDFENVWTPYTSNNFIKSFFSFFTNNVADAWCLKTNIAYISEEELQVVGGPIPTDIYELSRWIKIKRHSYTSWYVGFVNIRGNFKDVCTFLWKRRYVQWRGYVISVFNEQSKSLIGTINLIDIITRGGENVTVIQKESKIRITSGHSLVEFHFDSLDKFNTFKNVIDGIL